MGASVQQVLRLRRDPRLWSPPGSSLACLAAGDPSRDRSEERSSGRSLDQVRRPQGRRARNQAATRDCGLVRSLRTRRTEVPISSFGRFRVSGVVGFEWRRSAIPNERAAAERAFRVMRMARRAPRMPGPPRHQAPEVAALGPTLQVDHSTVRRTHPRRLHRAARDPWGRCSRDPRAGGGHRGARPGQHRRRGDLRSWTRPPLTSCWSTRTFLSSTRPRRRDSCTRARPSPRW